MASSDLRDELSCSICMNVYTDPVTLTCGHNFCQVCITRTWDNQEEREYKCPECMETFRTRPHIKRNLRLCSIAKSFLSTQTQQELYGVFCTYCIHSSVPAVKSCLMCEASLCDGHMRVHRKSPDHVLTELITSTGSKVCPVHKMVLEFYCPSVNSCICASCLADKHKNDQVESLDEAAEKKKEKLRNVLKTLAISRGDIEKRLWGLKEKSKELQDKASQATAQITSILSDIKKQLKVLKRQVMSEIDRQEEKASLTICSLIQQLEIKKDELFTKMCHIEELCSMTDPLTILQEQESETGDFCDTEVGDNKDSERDDKQVHDVGDLDEVLISETLHTGLSDIVNGVKRKINVQVEPVILLDLNTAANNVHVSGDLQTATWSVVELRRPETPGRFQYNQVISTRSFISGRHYWELETGESGNWIIGITYPSIERNGRQLYIGNNDKSWGLCKLNNRYLLKHNTKAIQLSHLCTRQRFRVYLDYDAGRLSFYELCNPIRHLHTFTATFTEPLHAAIWVWNGYLRIIS